MEVTDKHVIEGYEELYSVQLAGRQVILAENKSGAEAQPYMVCECRWDNPLNAIEYCNAEITDDYLEAMREFTRRLAGKVQALEAERDERGLPVQMLSAADCVPGGMDEDMNGKYVVVKAAVLSPEYRISDHQIGLCMGGNGAGPTAIGRAVFFKNLYTGKQTRYERQDIAGVLDPEKMPGWAREKLAFGVEEVENGKLYVPGANELFQYTPAREKEGAIKEEAAVPMPVNIAQALHPYTVTITETLSKEVSVEAQSRDGAEQLVRGQWRNSEYVLDADNFVDVAFEAKPLAKESIRTRLEAGKKQAAAQKPRQNEPNHCEEAQL